MGGSGGGGQSGAVDYPGYMKTKHESWLNDIDSLIDVAIANNPYEGPGWGEGWYVYNPEEDLYEMIMALDDFEAFLDGLDAGVDDEAAAFGAILQSRIDTDTIPSFEAGMRDINAVQTTSFIIGKAILYARKDEQVAQYLADLSGRFRQQTIEQRRLLATHYVEVLRLGIVAMKEHHDEYMEFETAAAKWDLEMYSYGGNMLAAIGGARAPGIAKPSRTQSAIGGAMAGAAVGTAISPGWGTAIGAIVGGVGGYLAAG
jgi:hypothetical protein